MKKVLFCALLLLGACKTNSNYDLKLRTWIGQSEYSLISQWGEPDNVFGIDENSYVYVYEQIADSPFDAIKYPYENELNYQASQGPKYGNSQISQVYYCKTLFTIRNRMVVDYSFNGDDCV